MKETSGVYNTMKKVRATKPLVHHLTNWVTISECANATLCAGALPVMAHASEEVEEMAKIASALVLNIGTLTPEFVKSQIKAGHAANRKGIPVVLDPVGAGATKLRTDSARKILKETRVSVIKGNAGEVATLAGVQAEVRGVESMGVKGDIEEIAKALAASLGCVVVATGAVDRVTDGKRLFRVPNGHPKMGRVVGTGCMSSSVVGAFCAVEPDMALASAMAMTYFCIAGEVAAKKAEGPGTFKMHFFDALENMDEKTLKMLDRCEKV